MHRPPERRTPYGVLAIAALVVIALGIGLYYWLRPTPMPQIAAGEPPAAEPAPAPAASPAAPAVQYPIEASPAASAASAVQAGPLPALARSDETMASALTDLLGRDAVLKMLQTTDFIPHAVATLDALGREHAAPRLWPVNPPPGRFTVQESGGQAHIAPDNAARYTPFVNFIEHIDTAHAAALYARFYPLFQQAYEELGYPDRPFNDRVVEVIDQLLRTPEPQTPPQVVITEVKGPVKPERPWVRYEYADPKYESLTAGQKIMLRMGLENERRLKAKLKAWRGQIAGTGSPAG